MEQPKFRGFSTETNSWHYGLGWIKSDCGGDKALLFKGWEPPVECELSSMGQFTGEYIGEKEIFHGDVIKVNQLTFESSAPLPENLNVEYYHGMYQLFRGREALMGLHLDYLKDGEVMGNMFENPELIARREE